MQFRDRDVDASSYSKPTKGRVVTDRAGKKYIVREVGVRYAGVLDYETRDYLGLIKFSELIPTSEMVKL